MKVKYKEKIRWSRLFGRVASILQVRNPFQRKSGDQDDDIINQFKTPLYKRFGTQNLESVWLNGWVFTNYVVAGSSPVAVTLKSFEHSCTLQMKT